MIRPRSDRTSSDPGPRHRRREPGEPGNPPDRPGRPGDGSDGRGWGQRDHEDGGWDRTDGEGRGRDQAGQEPGRDWREDPRGRGDDGPGWDDAGREQGRERGGSRSQQDGRHGRPSASSFGHVTADDVRRTPTGWKVGDEEVSDLTSAMVLADLLAADLPGTPPTPAAPPGAARQSRPDTDGAPAGGRRRDRRYGGARDGREEEPDIRQLRETVAQLEHALTVRVRVEQAIGVLAERHRLRPRQAFELLRSAARSRGRRVLEVAGEVVESSTNPLLRIPDELARPAAPRRGRLSRRG